MEVFHTDSVVEAVQGNNHHLTMIVLSSNYPGSELHKDAVVAGIRVAVVDNAGEAEHLRIRSEVAVAVAGCKVDLRREQVAARRRAVAAEGEYV